MNKKNLFFVVDSLLELRSRKDTPLVFDDNMLLDCAVRIYNSEMINEKKFVSSNNPSNKNILATEKQIHYLCKNNIDHNAETLTKKEAFDMISKHKKG